MSASAEEPRFDRIQLFVPEGDRASKTTPVDLHDRWVIRLLRACGRLFGGATSYGRGVGVWTEARWFYWDRVTVIEAWAHANHPRHVGRLHRLSREIHAMRRGLHQKAALCIINGRLRYFRGGSNR